MNQRTLLSTLFIAGMFAAPAAFAQDATSAEQQIPPATEQSSAAEASTMQGDAAASDQGKTSGDAGMATSASSATAADSPVPTEENKGEQQQHDH